MTDSLTPFKRPSSQEEQMSQVRRVEEMQISNVRSISATHHVSSRIYFPFHLYSMDERGFCPHSSPQAFDALYQNALGFLEKVRSEDIFQ